VDSSEPVIGALVSFEDTGPTPADAGFRAQSNVELFTPTGAARSSTPQNGPPPGAETPASLACIYQLVLEPPTVSSGCQVTDPNLVNPSGGSDYIFIVEPYDDGTAANDLIAFANYYNMPAPKFGKVYASGTQPLPAPPNWQLEEAVATQWAYAMAPKATIILVEADGPQLIQFMKAMDVARSYFQILDFCIFGQDCPSYRGEISVSWASTEWSGERTYDVHFAPPQNCIGFCFPRAAHPMVIFAAAGNIAGGGTGVFWPSASPWVVSAGGTTINRDSGLFTEETTWYNPPDGGGGGLSEHEPIQSWQLPLSGRLKDKNGIERRGTPDVSVEANPASGVGVYVNGAWAVQLAGGTSLSAPLLAGIANAAGNFYGGGLIDSNNQPYNYTSENSLLYSELAGAITYPSYFNDIKGSLLGNKCGPDGKRRAIFGWDFCTGIGSPRTLLGK
jgi:kumamolisin